MTGLTAADFGVAEDGTPQPITAFAAGEFPLAVAIGARSQLQHGRQRNRLAVAKSAARTFVGALRPDGPGHGARDRRRDRDRRAAVAGSRGGARRARSARRLGHDAAVRRRARRRSTRFRPPGDGARWCCCRTAPIATATRAAADLVDQARRRDVLIYPVAIGARAAAGVRGAGGGDRRPVVPRARAARSASTMDDDRARAAVSVPARLRAGARRVDGCRVARDRRDSRSPAGRPRSRARRDTSGADVRMVRRQPLARRSRGPLLAPSHCGRALQREAPLERSSSRHFSAAIGLTPGDEIGHHVADRRRSVAARESAGPVNAGRKNPALSRAARASSGRLRRARATRRPRASSPAASASADPLPDASAK